MEILQQLIVPLFFAIIIIIVALFMVSSVAKRIASSLIESNLDEGLEIMVEDITETRHIDQINAFNAINETYEPSPYDYAKRKKLIVLELNCDSEAEEIATFSEEINTAILLAKAEPLCTDVLVKINSGGGVVNGYGLVASEIQRLKNHVNQLVTSVDLIAASGGYLAACVGDKVIAAPFATLGSISVVSEFPNFTKLLEKIGVNFKEYTTGENKRTISQYREISTSQEEEFERELQVTHKAFVEHVKSFRAINQNLESELFSGRDYLGKQALEFGLIDEVMTSEELIDHYIDKNYKVIKISSIERRRQKSILSMISNYIQGK